MKYVSLLLVIMITAVSCGKNNQTGKSSGSSISGVGNGISIGNSSQQALLSTIMNENRCISGLSRITIQVPLNMPVALNAFHAGVTSEGDIAVVTSNNGQGVFTGYVCQRRSLPSGQGQLLGNPIVNRSYSCAIDEITAAKMSLGGVLLLNFRAIQYGRGSSLCR